MRLLTRSLTGNVYDIDCDENVTTIDALKDLIQEQSAVPKDSQKLIHKNKVLYSGLISACGLQNGGMVLVVCAGIVTLIFKTL